MSWRLVYAGELSDTVGANTTKELRVPLTVPSGYYPVGILNHSAGSSSCFVASYSLSGSYVSLVVRNITTVQTNCTAWAYVLCFKRAAS